MHDASSVHCRIASPRRSLGASDEATAVGGIHAPCAIGPAGWDRRFFGRIPDYADSVQPSVLRRIQMCGR